MGRPRLNHNSWFVYVIYSDTANKYYRGITNNVPRRLKQHNEGKGAKYTRGRGPWRLVALREVGDSRSSATVYEHYLRGLKRKHFFEWVRDNSVEVTDA